MIHISIDDILDPGRRDEVVAGYRAAGLGGERYGVVCPNEGCHKRICLQGWATAMANPKQFCLCRENYNGEQPAESIVTVLAEHGLPPRNLRVKVDMTEGPRKAKRHRTRRPAVAEPAVVMAPAHTSPRCLFSKVAGCPACEES